MGIIQAPPKEKKRWDKEDPEEIRRRKKEKALARGEHWSDSYDEETDHEGLGNNEHEGEMSLRGDGSMDLMRGKTKTGKEMMNSVQAARNRALGKGVSSEQGEVVLPMPDGYDPLKWAAMSRKEKMKVLGISEKEWNQMTREQQMKRMNKLAQGFHFYAMNKK